MKFMKGFYFAKDESIAKGYGNTIALIVDSKNIQIIRYAHFGYYTEKKENLVSELNKLKCRIEP